MIVPRPLYENMLAHAREEAPRECCGMIAAKDGELVSLHRARNSALDPWLYLVDAQDQLRIEMAIDDADLELGAIYHSHVNCQPNPSQIDIRLALHSHVVYLILGLLDEPVLRGWRIVDGTVEQVPVEVV